MPVRQGAQASTSNVVPIRPAATSAAQPRRRASRRIFGSVSKLPSGNWRARYPDPSYKGPARAPWINAPTTFLTKGDAAAWLAAREAEVIEYRWRPAPPQPPEPRESFAAYSARWLSARELKPSTVREYARMMKVLVGAFGETALDEITSADVRRWYAGLDPARKTAKAHLHALLRNVLGSAVDEELIEVNPCRIRSAGVTKRERKIQPATLDELADLIAELPDRYRALIMTAAWCALRFGELTELRQHDVQLAPGDSSGWLHVRRAVIWPTPHTPVVSTPKSEAGIRDVAIPPHLIPMLRAHIALYAVPGPDGLVFPNTEGNHMHHGSLYKVFKRARKAIGRPDLRFHDLRHTGATMAAQHAAASRQTELASRLSEMATGSTSRPDRPVGAL